MILVSDFNQIERQIYSKSDFEYSMPTKEQEAANYGAGHFTLNNLSIKLRSSKVTPKKVGQFVTLWKRNSEGITEPYNISDSIDLVVINSRHGSLLGQFIFPTTVLETRGIISGSKSEGKRGFRVYPPWDKAKSPQAVKTQKWQLEFFLEVNEKSNLALAKKLYLQYSI